MKRPGVDLSLCTLCGGCIDVSPTVFRMNDAGYLEVMELDVYPEDEINDAIMYCPEDAIYWEEE